MNVHGFSPNSQPILTASGVNKTFDRTRALDGATLELRTHEVHGLLGANGAGKSTLSKVIAGHVIPDAGTLVFKGMPLRLTSTRDALAAGVAIVMQETSLAPDLSVLENIFLPELGRPGLLSFKRLRLRAQELLGRLGPEHALPLDYEVRRLSAAQKQLVEIAKALALDSDLIIFDEPTASLSPSEVERLFDIMGRLRENGHSLVFVSHRLEEVFAITDRVTVMREGRTVAASIETSTLSQGDLVRHMVGQDLGSIYGLDEANAGGNAGLGMREQTALDGDAVFCVENLSAPPAVIDVSFSVRRGEILGLGGLVGAGRSKTAEAIFGLRPRAGGTMRMLGIPINPRKPADAIAAGIGFVAEDRRTQNIVPDMSVKENLLLAHLGAHKGFGLGYGRRTKDIERLMDRLGLPANRLLDANMLNFSGGMQQKIIMARWLLLKPAVLILDEPTKGVDIGTRSSIYSILREIAAEGVAVVVISSDFQELLGIADRIVVLSDGRSIADLPAARLNEEKLTLLAAPRTSMKRNTELLADLVETHGGTAFWALIDGDDLICLNIVLQEGMPDPGFRSGQAVRLADTTIERALSLRDEGFTTEADGGRATMIVPMRNKRGHDFGWIGLSVLVDRVPLPQAIREKVDLLVEQEL